MAIAEIIQQSAQKTTKLRTSNKSYTGNFNMEKNKFKIVNTMGLDLNPKIIPLTQRAIVAKAKSLFDEIRQKRRWKRDIRC